MTEMNDLQLKIDELTKQKEDLQNQLNMNSRGVEGLLNQLEAHKALMNDHLTAIVNLKSQLIGAQKQIKQFSDSTKG